MVDINSRSPGIERNISFLCTIYVPPGLRGLTLQQWVGHIRPTWTLDTKAGGKHTSKYSNFGELLYRPGLQ